MNPKTMKKHKRNPLILATKNQRLVRKRPKRRITVNITMKRNDSNESYFIYVSTSFQFAALPHYQFKEKKANSKD